MLRVACARTPHEQRRPPRTAPSCALQLHRRGSTLPVHTQQHRVMRDAFCVGRYTTWIGGSILASLSTFSTMWVTAQDYAADPQLIFKKFS